MRGSGGSNLTEILEHCIQKNIYLQNFAGAHKNEEEGIEILQTLGRRLGYLDREQQICQIELLEAETEERRRQLISCAASRRIFENDPSIYDAKGRRC